MTDIIGIILALVFGIPSLITLWKVYSKNITLCEIDLLNLYNSVTKNIDGLNTFYNKKEISEHLFLFKGLLYCSGKNDITMQDISSNLKLELPKDSFWHEFKIVKCSDDFSPISSVKNKSVEFSFDLFKHGEYFYFEGLFESPEESNEKNKIQPKHRIANLGRVERLKSINLNSSKKNIIASLIGAALLLGMLYLTMIDISFKKFEFISKKGTLIESEISSIDTWNIEQKISKDYSLIDLLPSKLTKEYTFTSLKTKDKITIKARLKKNLDYYATIFFLALPAILIFLSFSELMVIIRTRGVRKVLKEINIT